MGWKSLWGTKQDHLDSYPKESRKWIHQCAGCKTEGYKPELPQDYRFNAIRKRFPCLPLNEVGLCMCCKK